MKGLNKLILTTAVGFILSLVLFVVLIRPNLDQVGNLYQQAEQKQTDLQTLSAQILAYKNSQADLNAVQDKAKILDRILPRDNLQVAIQEVEAGASAAGVQEGLTINEQFDTSGKLAEVKPIMTGEVKATEVPYVMSVGGTFSSVVEFVQYLEHLPHLTEVSGITLSAVTSTADKPGLAQHDKLIKGSINGVFLVQKAGQ